MASRRKTQEPPLAHTPSRGLVLIGVATIHPHHLKDNKEENNKQLDLAWKSRCYPPNRIPTNGIRPASTPTIYIKTTSASPPPPSIDNAGESGFRSARRKGEHLMYWRERERQRQRERDKK
jgi:hypothetical protein